MHRSPSLIFLCAATTLSLLACGGSSSPILGGSGSGGGEGGAGSTGGSGGATASGNSSVGATFVGSGGGGSMIPVRTLPGLQSITFYERTGGTDPTPYTFTVDGPELTVRLPDPLAPGNFDIPGASTEYYDVYYSEEDGTFNLDGSYLTISGMFEFTLPSGGGLNLAEIGLNFTDTSTEFGNYVASYVALGDNKHEPSVGNCIDSDLQTHTTMGNTVGAAERLRLTLGFLSTSGPPK